MKLKRYGGRFKGWGIGEKRICSTLENRSVPEVPARREQWSGFAKKIRADYLLFLDESGVNIDMVRRYGWGKGGQRVADHATLNTPKSITLLSSIRLDGEMAFTTFQVGTTGDKFLTYLKEVLIPALCPGDIVVMDNFRTHHIQAVGELLCGAGAEVLYLPPYSPDLKPIEKLWSKEPLN